MIYYVTHCPFAQAFTGCTVSMSIQLKVQKRVKSQHQFLKTRTCSCLDAPFLSGIYDQVETHATRHVQAPSSDAAPRHPSPRLHEHRRYTTELLAMPCCPMSSSSQRRCSRGIACSPVDFVHLHSLHSEQLWQPVTSASWEVGKLGAV